MPSATPEIPPRRVERVRGGGAQAGGNCAGSVAAVNWDNMAIVARGAQIDPQLPMQTLRAQAAQRALGTPGVELVVLFGSAARGTARRDSDADIGVLGGEFWKQLELGSALAAELGREPHVVDLRSAPEALAYEIARTGVAVFEAEPFAWARFQARSVLRFLDFQAARERCIEGVRRRVLREVAKDARG
jgi:predicted nucleotidyltransferase